MFRHVTRFGVLRKVTCQVQRNLGVSAVLAQKSGTALDPIQQLFLEKIREYKSKSVQGKLLGATPEVEKALKEELDKVDRMFNATGKDMTKFPTFTFTGKL
ncbi:hypothetical protein C0Q70_12644 [Pomacea canaliculata]|uniref:Uncharacterized protein n=1 Tax=Pomacea canaliculata TaxID=400727 RepID=A0A2T7P267_POMCA|nr:hypothetical protein C0Q70_12644 [Pomacea canaliculata]